MSVMVGLEERSMGKRKTCSVGLEERSMEKRRFVASVLESCPASKFVSIVTDDLLMEILLRLPHARAVIQCGTVCKRWFSILSDLHFIRQFNQFHSHIKPPSSRSPPYTKSLRSAYSNIRIYEAFSEKSKILFGARRSINDNYLNFMLHPLTVKGSWKDLLLMDTNYQDYCIYNPLTRQQLVLPLPPRGDYVFCGFLCELKDSRLCYKILKIACVIENESEYVLDALVFCSETGKWCQSTLSCPRTLAPRFTDWGDCVAMQAMEFCTRVYKGVKSSEDLLHSIYPRVVVQMVIQYESGSFTCPTAVPVAGGLVLNMYIMEWFRAVCGCRRW